MAVRQEPVSILRWQQKHMHLFSKRGFVIPDDVKAICKDVLRHRIGLTYEAEAENINAETIIEEILKTVNVP